MPSFGDKVICWYTGFKIKLKKKKKNTTMYFVFAGSESKSVQSFMINLATLFHSQSAETADTEG